MKLKKVQWKSKKQKIIFMVLGLFLFLLLVNNIIIKLEQHKEAKFRWEEWYQQIGDLTYDEVFEHYSSLGYQCITNKTRYSLEESCEHISSDEIYPHVSFTSNKRNEVLFIYISNSESTLKNFDAALGKFIEMSSIALIFAETNQTVLEDWVHKTIEEDSIREFECFFGDPYELSFYNDNVLMYIGPHDIICNSDW